METNEEIKNLVRETVIELILHEVSRGNDPFELALCLKQSVDEGIDDGLIDSGMPSDLIRKITK